MEKTTMDSESSLMEEFARVTNGIPAQINGLRDRHIFKSGEVQVKHKVLAAMLWSIASRCEPCIQFYVSKAKKHGATRREIGEFLAVASTMGGCVGELWALKAYKAYKEQNSGAQGSEHSCC